MLSTPPLMYNKKKQKLYHIFIHLYIHYLLEDIHNKLFDASRIFEERTLNGWVGRSFSAVTSFEPFEF